MQQNQNKQMQQINEAQNLKEERAKNERIIKMQKEQELMKNNNIKEMIRQQKMMAEERKEMVSTFLCSINFYILLSRNTKRNVCNKETSS
tara:strand:+ start:537 stop:806 length:270 start_codon:yes stop_codon:yes gene_type:complete